ncbi:MAG TPA: 23S rRNA (adenine(2503)-C(2))-methyltransferase RlmN, partial [Thermopetrobacter sp.]|nr:23S rRNA (adenine(2503)-C(2))-methyltransferase RlmN [Thermopetrobacter sp.]
MEQTATTARPTLIGLGRPALMERLAAIGVPERQRRMRARQLWRWLYQRGAAGFAEMTDISKALRADLARAFDI